MQFELSNMIMAFICVLSFILSSDSVIWMLSPSTETNVSHYTPKTNKNKSRSKISNASQLSSTKVCPRRQLSPLLSVSISVSGSIW